MRWLATMSHTDSPRIVTLCVVGAARVLSFEGICAAFAAGTLDEQTQKLSIDQAVLKDLVKRFPNLRTRPASHARGQAAE